MPRTSFKIRRMRRSDCAAVARMNHALSGHPKDRPIWVKARFFEQQCLGPRKMASAWVATVADDPVGFAITQDVISFGAGCKFSQLNLLWVDEGFRELGIASALVLEIAKVAFRGRYPRLDTYADDGNKPANRLYQKLGFNAHPTRQTHYRLVKSS